jgi:hypothetical protein
MHVRIRMCGAHEKIVGRNMENIHPGQVEDRTEREIGTGHQFNETNSIMTEKTGGKKGERVQMQITFSCQLTFPRCLLSTWQQFRFDYYNGRILVGLTNRL